MNEHVDFAKKLKDIERLLAKQEYTASARECAITTEQALRQAVNQHGNRFDVAIQQKLQEEIRKRDKRSQGIDGLTMGQVVYALRDSGFLAAWGKVAGKNLSSFQIIDLEKLTQLRNKFMHEGVEATKQEAEFLLHCLGVILETFDLGESQQPIEARAEPQMSFTIANRIVDFLTDLPHIEDQHARRALLTRAGLDPQLYAQIDFDDPPAQFFQILVATLSRYGALNDRRNALQAVLTAAKNSVGLDKLAECDRLIQEVQQSGQIEHTSQPNQPNNPPPPRPKPQGRLAAMKRQMLEQRLADLTKKYTAANQQLLNTLSAVDQVTLQNQIQQLEKEIQETEAEMKLLLI